MRLLLPILVLFTSACTIQQQKEKPSSNSFSQAITTPAWYQASDFDTVKVLSWNVEHFVDSYDNPYIDNGRENTPPENMQERRKLFVEIIKEANADLVVLQEFESDSYAQQLAEEYFPELGYKVFAGHESNDWYMNVVVMSRIPLGLFHSYATSNTPIIGQTDDDGNPASQEFTNNRMWTTEVIVNPDYSFSLTGVHLKAGRGERNENWRLGQINLLRAHYKQLLALNPNQNILTVGDFNSTPDSDEFKAFLGAGTEVEFIDPLAGTDVFSHPADSAFWRIDHILPNRNMHAEIVNDTVIVNYFFSLDSMEMAADHLPMSVEIISRDL
ncbi:endonuclease/exonuclease/phosphatase family protein [Gracilimonas sp.]|uniref:endonuclease/exonuclease/phosphatase family protein n=1 Tax=Gracilimonas sp. TaxID=1974203 RepID=UPI0032F065D3